MTTEYESHISAALAELDAEHDRVTAERAAFERFRATVAETEPATTDGTATTKAAPTVLADPGAAGRALERVREAYRETVMALPHYDEVYGEPLAENVAGELGVEVAGAMTGERFTAPLRTALVSKAERAIRSRKRLLGAVEAERESLDGIEGTLEAVAGAFEGVTGGRLDGWSVAELVEGRDRVLAARERCDDLAADRQEALRTVRANGRLLGPDGRSYVYEPLAVEHPVLADIAGVGERLDDARWRLDRALVYRMGAVGECTGTTRSVG